MGRWTAQVIDWKIRTTDQRNNAHVLNCCTFELLQRSRTIPSGRLLGILFRISHSRALIDGYLLTAKHSIGSGHWRAFETYPMRNYVGHYVTEQLNRGLSVWQAPIKVCHLVRKSLYGAYMHILVNGNRKPISLLLKWDSKTKRESRSCRQ